MDPATGLVTRMVRGTNAARFSATLEFRKQDVLRGIAPRMLCFANRPVHLLRRGQTRKLGGPMGLAPIPRRSQCRMLTRYNMVPILKRWRSMPVTLRRILFDRQAGYFYINGPIKKWCRARESNSVFLIETRHITTMFARQEKLVAEAGIEPTGEGL